MNVHSIHNGENNSSKDQPLKNQMRIHFFLWSARSHLHIQSSLCSHFVWYPRLKSKIQNTALFHHWRLGGWVDYLIDSALFEAILADADPQFLLLVRSYTNWEMLLESIDFDRLSAIETLDCLDTRFGCSRAWDCRIGPFWRSTDFQSLTFGWSDIWLKVSRKGFFSKPFYLLQICSSSARTFAY